MDTEEKANTPPPLPPCPEPAWALRIRAEAENRPGVYRFLGPRGEVLYVGKSVQLRTRLLSWLRGEDGKAAELLRVTRDVAWSYRGSEFEALLDEFREIRRLRPRFNVVHRKDRRFAWIRLTEEPAPRLVASLRPPARTTRRGGGGGIRHFGPFPASRSLPRELEELAREAGLRDCSGRTPIRFSDQRDLFASPPPPVQPCPREAFGSCEAPCAMGCTEAEYRNRVEEAVAFLEGRSDRLLAELEARMQEAANSAAFEVAARLRDRRERLGSLRNRITRTRSFLEELTFVYRTGTPERHHLVRGGMILATFTPPPPGDRVGHRRLREEVETRLAGRPPHPVELEDEAREELFLVARWFRENPGEVEQTTPVAAYLQALDRAEVTPPPVRGRRPPRSAPPPPAAPRASSA